MIVAVVIVAVVIVAVRVIGLDEEPSLVGWATIR